MLDGELKAAAEAFFGVELGDVELHFNQLPAFLNADAFAYGDHIYVNAENSAYLSQRHLEILGHELTHVIQQRQGRVGAALRLCGAPANQEAGLEREAQEMGRRFAWGGPSELPRLALSRSHPAVVQRLLRVGEHHHFALGELRPKPAAILALISGGEEWLEWIIADPNATYYFADELQLLAGVQMGLHATPLILLPNLGVMVHAFKLAELSEAELKTLQVVEDFTESNSAAKTNKKVATKVLHAHDIWSQSDLTIGQTFLTEAGVEEGQVPLFQATTLASNIALYNLVDGALTEAEQNPILQKEAASFAVGRAQDQLEFCDYYQFYMSTVKGPDAKSKLAERRERRAESIAEEISPLLYGWLWCPSLKEVPTPAEVPSLVRNWLVEGKRLGFARLSSALFQINENAGLNGAKGLAAKGIIDQFMDRVHAVLVQQAPASVALSQDGMERYYQYSPGPVAPQLCYSAYGNLTLRSFTLAAPNQQEAPRPKGGNDGTKRGLARG